MRHKLRSVEIRKCAARVIRGQFLQVRKGESRACIADKELARFMVIKCQHLDCLYSTLPLGPHEQFYYASTSGNKFAPR